MKPFRNINVNLINIKSITFMKKTLVLILFIILTAGTSFSQESYDLNKTVRTALNNSLTISTFNNNISIQELNLKSSYGELIPSLSFSGNWSKSNTYSKGGIIYQNGVPITTTLSTKSDNFGVGLSSNVTLFNGFANYDNVELQQQNIASQKLNLEQAKSDIVMGIYQFFFDVLKKEQILKANEDNLAVSREQLARIKEYVNVGKKTQSEVYKQDVQVAQNEMSGFSSANELSIRR